jgi:hypothetical protein
MPGERRLYSEQEVTDLIRKAVELQESGSTTDDFLPGLGHRLREIGSLLFIPDYLSG